jgi:LysR family transcriptional regulator, cyn operon transcriptional activator
MELRHIRYFIRAAELLHFTHAAESLFISQPTLSIHIQQLEEELGAPLFTRTGRHVRLTEAGQLFLVHARQSIRALELAQEEIADLQGLRRGTLRIGALFSFSQELIPQWLVIFNNAYPQVQVVVQSGVPDEIEQMLLAGTVDFALSFLPPDSEEIETERLFEEEIVVVIAKENPIGEKKQLEYSDLSTISFALPGRHGASAIRRQVDRRLAEEKIEPKILAEMNDIHALLTIAERGNAATILSRTAVGNRSGLRLMSLPGKPLYIAAGIMWHRAAQLSPATKAFLNVIKTNLPINHNG